MPREKQIKISAVVSNFKDGWPLQNLTFLPCATRMRSLISGRLPDRKEQYVLKYSMPMPSSLGLVCAILLC